MSLPDRIFFTSYGNIDRSDIFPGDEMDATPTPWDATVLTGSVKQMFTSIGGREILTDPQATRSLHDEAVRLVTMQEARPPGSVTEAA